MTERLYVQDPYCQEFDAVIISCTENKGRYEIVLNRTCFYPEGGGQSGDRGVLCVKDAPDQEIIEATVFDTHEHGEEVVHYCREKLNPGTHVHGMIDWEYRFDLMQNHSGEHIVSGLLHQRFGCNNVGFHMGSETVTIDLDCDISWEELLETERKANQIIWKNAETDIHIYNHEQAKDVQYRSKKEIPGDIRVVTFPEADTCACCGTHVQRAGEIGLIRIISVMKFHEGVRVEMLSGRRAFLYTQQISAQNKAVSVLLSAKPTQTAAAVEKMKDNLLSESYRAGALELKIFSSIASNCHEKGNILLLVSDYSSDSVRKLCVAVMEVCKGKCAVFSCYSASGSDSAAETEWKYALGEIDGNLKEMVADMNRKLNGRGGGKPFFAQGSCICNKEQISDFVDNDKWTIMEIV